MDVPSLSSARRPPAYPALRRLRPILGRRRSHGLREGGYAQEMTNNPIQLQKHLGGIDYPADKDTLIQKARDNGADDHVIQPLVSLPAALVNSHSVVSERFGRK